LPWLNRENHRGSCLNLPKNFAALANVPIREFFCLIPEANGN